MTWAAPAAATYIVKVCIVASTNKTTDAVKGDQMNIEQHPHMVGDTQTETTDV